jgi:uncharacterized membrane protein
MLQLRLRSADSAVFVIQCLVVWFAVRIAFEDIKTAKGAVIFLTTISLGLSSFVAAVFVGPILVLVGAALAVWAYVQLGPQRR